MASININMLKGKTIEKGMTISELAEKIGFDKSTLYRKLKNNGDTLLVKDANKIVEVLGLSQEETVAIFFNVIFA